jgi:hypothetical protein
MEIRLNGDVRFMEFFIGNSSINVDGVIFDGKNIEAMLSYNIPDLVLREDGVLCYRKKIIKPSGWTLAPVPVGAAVVHYRIMKITKYYSPREFKKQFRVEYR